MHHKVYYYFKWHIGKIGIIIIDTYHKKVHVSRHVQSLSHFHHLIHHANISC